MIAAKQGEKLLLYRPKLEKIENEMKDYLEIEGGKKEDSKYQMMVEEQQEVLKALDPLIGWQDEKKKRQHMEFKIHRKKIIQGRTNDGRFFDHKKRQEDGRPVLEIVQETERVFR